MALVEVALREGILGHRSPALWADELRAHLAEEAREWRVPAWAAIALLVFPFVGVVALIGGRAVWPQSYAWVMGEDNLVEWASSVAWFAAAIAAAVLGLRLLRRQQPLVGCLWLLVAVVAVVAGGEEISWGQRVFGFGTPDSVAKHNHQGEVTIHNLSSLNNLLRLSMLVIGVYGSFFAYAARARFGDAHRLTVDLLLPPVFLSGAFLLMALYRIAWAVLLAPEPLRETPASFGEWPEFCVPFAVFLFAVLNVRRLLHSSEERAR